MSYSYCEGLFLGKKPSLGEMTSAQEVRTYAKYCISWNIQLIFKVPLTARPSHVQKNLFYPNAN